MVSRVDKRVSALLVASLCLLSSGCTTDDSFDNPFGSSVSADGGMGADAGTSDTEEGNDEGQEGGEDPTEAGGDTGLSLVDLPGGDEDETDAGGDQGTTATDTAGMDPEDGGACVEFSDVLAPLPPSVLFVLDRSGSMMEDEFDPEDPDKTRWQVLYESVAGVVMQEQFDTFIEFGAKTFSTKGWGECGVAPGVDIDPALENGGPILDVIPSAQAWVNGGTPTHAALTVSLDYMRAFEAEGSKAIVLVTDGSIGCSENTEATLAAIVDDLSLAREQDGISTFVVGIEPKWNSTKGQLAAMALAGGGEDYFEADDAEALAEALDEVVEASYAGSCLLHFDEAPHFPELTEVEVDDQVWPEVDDCTSEDGWVWDNDSLTRMRLCNAACEALVETQAAHVEYHCSSE